MQVCPVCAGQGCNHCGGQGFHGVNEQLGFVTINRRTGTGISVASGLVGAIAWPMMTGKLKSPTTSINAKATDMLIGLVIGGVVGGLGSYAGYQIQN